MEDLLGVGSVFVYEAVRTGSLELSRLLVVVHVGGDATDVVVESASEEEIHENREVLRKSRLLLEHGAGVVDNPEDIYFGNLNLTQLIFIRDIQNWTSVWNTVRRLVVKEIIFALTTADGE